MSRSARRTYRQTGVLLPLERDVEANVRVIQDSRVPQNDNFMNAGFLFVKAIKMGIAGKFLPNGNRIRQDKSMFVVQSVSTGELFFNKLLEQPWDPATSVSIPPPLELRASTYRRAIGDPSIDHPANNNDVQRNGILPNVPYFNKLRFWQELDPGDSTNPDCTVYSLFFEFCNGGSLADLILQYSTRVIAIPESFIWLVAEQLFSALVVMEFGTLPVQDDEDDQNDEDDEDDEDDRSQHGNDPDEDSNPQPNNWARIYHRDLHPNNVFINYPPRGPGRIPRAGIEGNAFPEIVVGDFGYAGIQGDDPAILPTSVYSEPDGDEPDSQGWMADWEDIYAVGSLLREMVMTHIPDAGPRDALMRPRCRRVQDTNQEPTAPPYSDELIELLQLFEYPNQENSVVRSLRGALDTTFPSPEDLRDTLLPQAQARAVGFRRPANRPAGYYDNIDVSWTKPQELMPFCYQMSLAAEAGDGPDGGPPPEEDDAAEGDHGDGGSGDGSGSGGGDAGDVEMSDHPSSSEAGQDSQNQPADSSQQQGDQGQAGEANNDNHDEGSDGDSQDDEDDDESSSPPPPTSEQVAMRELGKMHKWNGAKPRYELRSLDFGVPAILPLKSPP